MSFSNQSLDYKSKFAEFIFFCTDIFGQSDNDRKIELMDAIEEVRWKMMFKTGNGMKRNLSNGLQNCTPIKKARLDEISVDLPNELWQKVFSYLPTRTILGKVAKVCKRFYEITRNPSMLSNVSLRKIGNGNHDDVINVLKRSTCLNEVIIIDCDRYENLIETALKSNRKMDTLKLITHTHTDFISDDEIDDDNESDFGSVVIRPQLAAKCINKIKRFGKSLSNLHLKVTISEKVLRQILTFENLKSLTIEDGDLRLRPRHFESMAKNFKNLEEIVLHVKGITPEASNVTDLKPSLKEFFKSQSHSLKSLWIKEREKCFNLFGDIDECSNLERFSTSSSGIWNFERYTLAKNEVEALCRLKHLKYLDVDLEDSWNRDSLWKSLFAKTNFEKLETLCLGHSIEEEDLEFLQVCPKLTVLDLSKSTLELNDNQIKVLLMKLPLLKKLNIQSLYKGGLSEKLLHEVISHGIYVEMDTNVMARLDDYSNFSIRLVNLQNQIDWHISMKNEWTTWNAEEAEKDD